ncbi:MAG TPA: hypothetical protein VGQ59_05485 [Cyclobacteriaceae bacterium]|nr:hypothetical protein [Cyclobacteriaceae bacterium]
MKSSILIIATVIAFQSVAQNKKSKSRLQPGRLYEAGETLYAPRLGFIAKVPEGWQGLLPQETQVFSLSSMTSVFGEIYVFGREQGDIRAMQEAWNKGIDFTETIRLKANAPVIKDGILSSEVIGEGEVINKGNRAFAIARCNPSGPCVTLLALAPIQFYETVKNVSTKFMETSSFEPPSNAPVHADLNWKEFLSNKSLLAYVEVEGGTKQNMVEFCADGTFTSDVDKTGWLKKQNAIYNGRNSGQWTVEGIGVQTKLHLTFKKKKVPPLEVTLTIKDEKIYAEGERYFIAQSTKCK